MGHTLRESAVRTAVLPFGAYFEWIMLLINDFEMMKKIFAAAVLLGTMTACGGSQQKALPLEGTQWKLARMEAIPAKAVAAEADFFTLEFNGKIGRAHV